MKEYSNDKLINEFRRLEKEFRANHTDKTMIQLTAIVAELKARNFVMIDNFRFV